ncbi:MAG: hypothetical protein K2P23_09940, partial [Lachnospiraceae bacterium]|nr:hypothetical protein [Lachnospiraceae bacterium]
SLKRVLAISCSLLKVKSMIFYSSINILMVCLFETGRLITPRVFRSRYRCINQVEERRVSGVLSCEQARLAAQVRSSSHTVLGLPI